MKTITRLVALTVLLVPVLANAGFTLGGPRPPTLSIAGHVKFGPVFSLSPDEGGPWLSFENSAASLILSGSLPGRLRYIIHPAMAGGNFVLLDCNATWLPTDNFGLVIGQHKVPFDRVYGSSAGRLLFGTRSPLVPEFSAGYQLGVTPAFTPLSGLKLSAGVYNGTGLNRANTDPHLLYAAGLEFTPLGDLPNEESAHRGYDKPVGGLIPGFWTNTVRDTINRDMTTINYGGHAALRWQYLALDAAFYRRHESQPDETDDRITDGLGVQGGYAFAGCYEPIVRFTALGLADPTMTIEAGFNWYLNSYASRLGLNFECIRSPDSDPRRKARLFYEFQF